MAREKMHKEMVPPGGIFMRSTCGSYDAAQSRRWELGKTVWKTQASIYSLYVNTNKNGRKKLAGNSVENTENLLANS